VEGAIGGGFNENSNGAGTEMFELKTKLIYIYNSNIQVPDLEFNKKLS
jgi:hypothetical protein